MISPAQPLNLSASNCNENDLGFCQVLSKHDLPAYQFPIYCDTELTGGLQKLPCEELVVINNLSDVFDDNAGMNISNNRIEPFGTNPHYVNKAAYFEHNKFYQISIQLINHINGDWFVTCGDTVSDPISNGVFSQIMWSGPSSTSFSISGTDGDLPLDGYVANVSVQCVRYSELYDLVFDPTNRIEFTTPVCIKCTPGSMGLSMSEAIPTLQAGKIYKLSFKITENTCNSPGTEFAYGLGATGPLFAQQIGNGFFEIEVMAGANPTKLFQLNFPTCFDGKVQDITIYEKNQIRMAIYDQDKNLLPDMIAVNEVEGVYLATLPDLAEGCYRLGYADLCSDSYGQFTGANILDLAQWRELVNMSDDSGEGVFDTETTAYIIYHNFIKGGILYNFNISGIIPGDNATTFDVTATIGGTTMTLVSTVPTPSGGYSAGVSYTFNFLGTAGISNADLIISVLVSGTGATIAKMTIDSGGIFDGPDLHVNQTDPQFIVESYSDCLTVIENVNDCELVELKWRNNKPFLGINFDVTGYDYARMWLPMKLWHPKYPKDREIFMNTSGNRRVNYSDTDEVFTLTTGYIPGYMLKTLALAIDCDTFLINGDSYVCTSEESSPEWNKNTSLAFVELEFVKQDRRYLKSNS